MTEEPSSVSSEKFDSSLSPSSLAINSTTQLIMASKGPQRKLLSGSENCNPNVIHGSCKRKINNCPKSSAAEHILESNNTPKQLTGQACAEFNLISPPRKHVCSSRRCASKNPDYAVPATVNPKKFLASKRHALLPKGSTMCKCSLRTSKEEDSAADDQFGSIEAACNSCSHESQKRRWSSDDSASRHLTENGEPMTFLLTSTEQSGLHYPDSGQVEKAFMNEAVRLAASETAHQERSTDTPKSWNCWNHSPSQTNHVDTQDHPLKAVTDVNQSEDSTPPRTLASFSGSESKHRAAYFNKRELQASPLPAGGGLCRSAGEGLYRFGTSCLNSTPEQSSSAAAHDGNPSQLMPENEEGAISPSPEKSGNWRLNAVLESFGNLSPTREGRVKTLVRAFESLLSVTERKVEQQARKPGGCLKFSYLSSNTNLDGEENSPREEDFSTYGGEGESEKEGATDDEEERVGQWQPSLSMGDAKDDEIDDRWQRPHTEPVYSQSIVESEQWLQKQDVEQECPEPREEIVSDDERDGLEKLLQNQEEEAQEVHDQSVVSDEGKGGMVLQEGGVNYEGAQEVNAQLVVEDADKGGMGKRWQEHEAEREYAQSLQEGVNDEEVGKMDKLLQKQQQDDKGKQTDEQQGAAVFAQTPEKRHETNKGEQQPRDMVSTQKLLIEGEVKKDRASQELEVRHIPDLSVNPVEASFERKLPHQIIRTNIQRRLSQTSIDGHFASTAARKKQRSRIRETRRGSNCSISSTRPPLLQKTQTQYTQDKPRFSKPQPFKLLTEARGHMKEQEFMTRLRKLLEEEEKLRVPLAQGLPWTTDEPEIPLKPPVKENTKPLDIHLNTDLRAMERADFDRFIAEKLLYIEERRLEEESRRRAAEEEEIKKMRQDMVPKAQLMPYFDRPFRPRRSSKRPTIPKEPQFQLNKQPKRQKCAGNST